MEILFLKILCTALIIAIVIVFVLYIRMRMELHFLSEQLKEIERGSHIELAVNSAQRPLKAFCRVLNRVLTGKDAAYIQYERAQKQLKQNISGLAHDIRTPLTGASGYVQLAEACEDPGKREHYLKAAVKRLMELEEMLEELFLYTKLTGEEFSLSLNKMQALPLLSECLLGLYAQFEEKGVSPQVDFASEDFCVRADEEALRRIFLNLIQNFLVHGVGGITIMQRGSLLIFENDIPEESVLKPEQMFDRFYKGETARRKGSSGLGLFVVKELMRRMDGDAGAQIEGRRLRIILSWPVNGSSFPEDSCSMN